MSTILLSFTPDWFDLLERGEKKFEYRKHFPKGKTRVLFYVSNPVKAVTGIAEFDERQSLAEWKKMYSSRSEAVAARIDDFLTDCRYAMPCLRFQKTNRIELKKIQADIPNFIVPRMYYYLDGTSLLDYFENQLTPIGEPIVHSFENLKDDDIC